MRELTFKGFLKLYVKELSRGNTVNIQALVSEVETGNHRLCAPLVLYAVSADKKAAMLRSLGQSPASGEMREMLNTFKGEGAEQRLDAEDLSSEYRKVFEAYKIAKQAPERDMELKKAMREKVLQMMASSRCTKYRIYTDLKLNPGNVNSWLKNGDGTKVSYKSAKLIMDYVMRRTPPH